MDVRVLISAPGTERQNHMAGRGAGWNRSYEAKTLNQRLHRLELGLDRRAVVAAEDELLRQLGLVERRHHRLGDALGRFSPGLVIGVKRILAVAREEGIVRQAARRLAG